MKINAQLYVDWFHSLPTDERGDKKIQEELDDLLASLYQNSVSVSEECPESFDSSLLFILENGEKVLVENPHQEAFSADLYQIKRRLT